MPSSPSETGKDADPQRRGKYHFVSPRSLDLDPGDTEVRVFTFDELVARFIKYALLDQETATAMVAYIRGLQPFDPSWIDRMHK